MTSSPEPTGSLQTALTHAARLLETHPAMAALQASEILQVAPGHPVASWVLGAAQRRTGDPGGAVEVLERLVAMQPRWAKAHYELGLALADNGRADAAGEALRRAVALKPDMPDAWRAIGDLLMLAGDAPGADAAYARHIKASTQDPRLLAPAAALVEGRIAQAESLLRAHLKQFPTDVAALRMLAEVAARLGRNADAEVLLESCLELAPGFHAARHQYALVLQRRNKPVAALREINKLETLEPRNAMLRNLKAVVLVKVGEYAESLELYAEVLRAEPRHPKIWLSYGHTLATAGRDQESIAAYRRSIELQPGLGEAYWSLANLKTFRFSDVEQRAMQTQLAGTDLTTESRVHFEFALGKALEDARRYAESFEHYVRANELRRPHLNYHAGDVSDFVRRSKQVLSREFFSARAGWGAPHADPIFIVGMPRAGSTLIEQILSSHPEVEGTMELPDLTMIVETLSGKPVPNREPSYPGLLQSLTPEDCRRLGEDYVERTRVQRKTPRPFFVDKMPNNFSHIGLLQLALPHAKIIDARRHPMACCFSVFKQHFAEGHRYSYSLEDTARYYRDYVELMDHVDRALPQRVHRVFYEDVIADPEAEVRRLLSYCGLPFDGACMRFHENDRPVRTASAQQVRQPLYREGVEHWRCYEAWLAPLEHALGEVLAAYPGTPAF